MIRYEVTTDIDQELLEPWRDYIVNKHIPEIWATGCFARIAFEQAGPLRFRTSYIAATQADLDRYLNEHTAHFRADFLAHFPHGTVLRREIWSETQHWG